MMTPTWGVFPPVATGAARSPVAAIIQMKWCRRIQSSPHSPCWSGATSPADSHCLPHPARCPPHAPAVSLSPSRWRWTGKEAQEQLYERVARRRTVRRAVGTGASGCGVSWSSGESPFPQNGSPCRGRAGRQNEGGELVPSEVLSLPQRHLPSQDRPSHLNPEPVLWWRQRPLQPQPRQRNRQEQSLHAESWTQSCPVTRQ